MKVLQLFNKMRHRFETYKAFRSPSNFEKYLRKKGCVIGKDIFWCNIKSLDIDLTRPQLIQIGDKCKINNDVTLMTHDGASNVFRHLYHDFLPSSGPIIIGENVYIGRKTTILKNVTIGDNVIIGYGSLVTKDIPSNCVAAGVPAKGICSIDEYYKRRKVASRQEALVYAKRFQLVTGRKPTVFDMYEEFPFYLDGNAEDPGFKLPIVYQTRGFYEEWKNNHRAPYHSFDEFLKDAGVE